MGAVALLYDVALWQFIRLFLLFTPPLLLSGIWLGFTGLQIIVTLGRRGIELANVAAWFLSPFSGAYYPIEVLPVWGQKLSAFLPMSHVFQGMRAYIMHKQDPTPYLKKGYVLGGVYAMLAILLFIYCFNRSKKKGLARLAGY
jgi:ABC-2 type transport system permease protein